MISRSYREVTNFVNKIYETYRERCVKEDMKVKISVKTMVKRFHPCTVDFIKHVCFAGCGLHRQKEGAAVFASDEEVLSYKGMGVEFTDENRLYDEKTHHCPFEDEDGLCKMHMSKNKPLSCVLSPFTLNDNGTLVIGYRYYNLKCYKVKEGKIPVYKAHRASLIAMFGEVETDRIITHVIEFPNADFYAEMKDKVFNYIGEMNKVRRRIKKK